MPPIEVGTTRAIGAVTAEITRKAGGQTITPAPAPAAGATPAATVSVATSAALDPGAAPVTPTASRRSARLSRAVNTP